MGKHLLFFVAVATVAMSGCGNQKVGNINGDGPLSDEIYSNRPIAARPQVVTVHLSKPALLAVGKKTAKGWVIAEADKQAVLNEQAALIATTQKADPTAKVLYQYRLVINAVTFIGSSNLKELLKNQVGVVGLEVNSQFGRPTDMPSIENSAMTGGSLPQPTSVDYIGADQAHKMGFDGKGVRVGIIDTGIDYTHAMLGGSGNPNDYKSINPAKPSSMFPNDKVIGGVDLVGTDYDAASELPKAYIPVPDSNPLDEAGHGSHVAGTVAGVGDGVNTYSGVAPAAKLYAIKVFGKAGSTSDAVVIAALEYAANPKGDLQPDDQLDVVNLSLGGSYGTPHVLYNEAIKNLSKAGTAVVAAAGNAGPQDYIVGAPATADEAISVAASIDGSTVNWIFASSMLTIAGQQVEVKAVEGSVSKPVSQADGVQGKLVDIALADKPLSDDQKAKLKGNVALIQRGGNPFADKVKNAFDGGAIGVVVANNAPGEPISMGGDGHSDIPAIMVTQDIGNQITAAMKTGDVTILFKTGKTIQQPELIDTITSFSSKGPRSEDDLIKPEIAGPGAQVLSAAMGQGNKGVRFDGTSMATPHIVGVVALLKQAHKDLNPSDFKSLLMNNALGLHDTKKADYPISLQGAGRVQIVKALQATSIATPSVSLGLIQSTDERVLKKAVMITNLTDKAQTYSVTFKNSTYLTMTGRSSITVGPKATEPLLVTFSIKGLDTEQLVDEADGSIVLTSGDQTLSVPAMAMRVEISGVHSTGIQNTPQGLALNLGNQGLAPGAAIPFNYLGEGTQKAANNPANSWKSTTCNLKSAGYRIIDSKDEETGKTQTYLQFAFEVFDPLSNWTYCEVNALIDKDGDGKPDLELAGIWAPSMLGDTAPKQNISILLNAGAMRQIRSDYETKLRQGLPVPPPNYAPSVIDIDGMGAFPQSNVAILQVKLDKLGGLKTIGVKLSTTDEDSDNVVRPDDFLTKDFQQLSLDPNAQAYTALPEGVVIPPGASGALKLTKGQGTQPLVIYYPNNHSGGTSQVVK